MREAAIISLQILDPREEETVEAEALAPAKASPLPNHETTEAQLSRSGEPEKGQGSHRSQPAQRRRGPAAVKEPRFRQCPACGPDHEGRERARAGSFRGKCTGSTQGLSGRLLWHPRC